MITDIVDELTDDAGRERLDAGRELSAKHRTDAGIEFDLTITKNEGGLRLVFRAARAARAKPASPPAAPSAPGAAPAFVSGVAGSGAAGPAQASPPAAAAAGVQATAPGAAPIYLPAPAAPRLSAGLSSASAEPDLDNLLERAALQGASDVFISNYGGVRMRVGAQLVELQNAGIDAARLPDCFAPMWPRIGPALDSQGSVDFALGVGVGPGAARFRVNLFRELGGLAAVFRPIRRDPPSLRSLGLGEELGTLTQFNSGLVLMTGPTGSGKSTTLVALLEQLNRSSPCHIVTLEDPIEYVYPQGRALIHQREIGTHVDSFSSGLRAALRESPDIILVGEMRDRETISAALTAAETGHLVLSTLHCADAGSAVNRIVDVFPEHQQRQIREQLASSLRAVVTQALLPGIRGPRVAAYELMRVNLAVATKIREGRGHQLRSEIQKGRNEGMVPLELSLAQLVRGRRVAESEARRHAHDPRLLDEHLRQL
nr:PilT/PilU family type 4a pilus ATPase [Pseudenhygromyxa sp. WMMC2535]